MDDNLKWELQAKGRVETSRSEIGEKQGPRKSIAGTDRKEGNDVSVREKSQKWRDVEKVHAYVDGRLTDSEMREMERYMEEDAETREVVEAYVLQTQLLRELFGKPAVEAERPRRSIRNDH